MLFSLEVLQAKFGDCLILHFGNKNDHKLMVIDGGPDGIYRNFLKPRLLELRDKISPGKSLPITMVMVSHMDDDHVNGIVSLTGEVVSDIEDQKKPAFELNRFWFNTFDDIIGNLEIPKISSAAASASALNEDALPGLENIDHSLAAVIASTSQGRQLRDDAKFLAASVNDPFKKPKGMAKLVRGDEGQAPVDLDELSITVLHPTLQRLKEFQKKWDEDLKKAKEKGDDNISVATFIASLNDKDKSPFNLSSIVCLVESGGKKILLTGDSRSKDIYDGLKTNGLLDENGKFHVDILKVPHHGSKNNASDDFYLNVTADHYVVSADGKFDNPDKETLDIFSRALKKGTLHFTNLSGLKGLKTKMNAFVKKLKEDGSKLNVEFKDPDASSFFIHLGSKI